MATSPSDPPAGARVPAVEVLSGGPATAGEIAAIAAALEAIVEEPDIARPVSRWRWSGRGWSSPIGGTRGWARMLQG